MDREADNREYETVDREGRKVELEFVEGGELVYPPGSSFPQPPDLENER